MKTEAEARKCWCPFARVLSTSLVGDNIMSSGPFNRVVASRDGVPEPTGIHTHSACIASECMAWRWDEPFWRHPETGVDYTSPQPLNVKPGLVLDKIVLGYCGLAGHPSGPVSKGK